jgi:hypothetical protein
MMGHRFDPPSETQRALEKRELWWGVAMFTLILPLLGACVGYLLK